MKYHIRVRRRDIRAEIRKYQITYAPMIEVGSGHSYGVRAGSEERPAELAVAASGDVEFTEFHLYDEG